MYLITGATGNVGSQIVEQLLELGKPVRVFTRDASKAARWGGRVSDETGDFRDTEAFGRAAEGVEGVFLMNGSLDREVFGGLVRTLREQGRPTVVFLSSTLAGSPELAIGRLHKEKEDALRESGLRAKFVRPVGFMSNAYQWIGSIKAEGVVYNPMGSGRFAPIAPEDIAAVATRALTDSNLSGEVFELTGREIVTVPAQVETLAGVLGRQLRTVEISKETAIQNLTNAGLPPQLAAAIADSYEAVRMGRSAQVTDTVELVTGRAPMTFGAWARAHASRFA